MITDIRYPFGKYNVVEKDNNLFLEKKSQECSSEQYLLFSSMLNFGYIGFEPGVFSVTAKDIINFWKYACSTILKNYLSRVESFHFIFICRLEICQIAYNNIGGMIYGRKKNC
jgi:hypothetical protein